MPSSDFGVVVAPQLSVRNGRAAVDFYRAAFGARELYRVGGVDGFEEVVAQLAVGDATFWVADESPEHGNHSPESLGGGSVRMLLVVDDPAGVASNSASPSQSNDSGTRYGAPSAAAVAAQRSMS